MKNIAIIPARGGSKRIPRKNIKSFLGKPIIAYSIEVALESKLFDEVMVSTDDEEIATVAKQYGATIPFMRDTITADDDATTLDVLMEVLTKYKELGYSFNYACCLYATAPLASVKRIKEAYDLLLLKEYFSVFPVIVYSYPIWRSLKIENNRISMNFPEYKNSRSQDLQPSYHDAGQFYFLQVKSLYSEKTLFTSNSGAIIIDEMEGQDIDNLSDWTFAELKYKYLNYNNEG